jgi:hypothetical protein
MSVAHAQYSHRDGARTSGHRCIFLGCISKLLLFFFFASVGVLDATLDGSKHGGGATVDFTMIFFGKLLRPLAVSISSTSLRPVGPYA